jgi:sugar lactone lactonase YvrE
MRIVVPNALRKGVWLGVSVVLLAATVETGALGASGGSGSGIITTLAGTGTLGFSGDGGPAATAQLGHPWGVAVDGQGNVYFADTDSERVRKVDPAGTITTFAGTGAQGFSGDGGPATSAQLNLPTGVAVDGQGNVYIVDTNNSRVRKVDPAGTITTFAGSGTQGFSGDGGPATAAQLTVPEDVAVDGQGNVYIVDTYNNRMRKVDPAGTITTFAGSGTQGFSGDGGPATAAQLNLPDGVAVDGRGNVYIPDTNNDRVRKVDPAGTITTFAGSGTQGFSGDGGPATAADLNQPTGVAVDGQGDVYIADYDNFRVRKVDSAGTITTFAGTGASGAFGDGGPATSAQLYFPREVAVDGEGNVYIADTNNLRLREVGPPPPVLAKAVNASVVSGTVLVELPHTNTFVPLARESQVPVGATFDTTKGRVRIVSALPRLKIQSSDFFQGVSQITQARSGLTDATLVGGKFGICAKGRGASAAQTVVIRHLWGSGKGKFRTKGKYASAAIRGTTWDTIDSCDGTLIKVTAGAVSVRDLVAKRTVVVTKGHSYLARAR